VTVHELAGQPKFDDPTASGGRPFGDQLGFFRRSVVDLVACDFADRDLGHRRSPRWLDPVVTRMNSETVKVSLPGSAREVKRAR
jgi:hypothetical protein